MSSYPYLTLSLLLTLPVMAQQGAQLPVPIQAEKLPVDQAKANEELAKKLIVKPIAEGVINGTRLAGLYTDYTGKRVIVTSAAAKAELAIVQDASPENPLTYAEAAELIRKTAVLEGFVFTQHPEDPNLEVLTVASSATRPTNVNVDIYNEGSTLPDKDIVITYVMSLSYIKPDQAVQVFTQVVGQFGPYASISAVPNASAVVITEKASLIKSLIDLKQTIDVPGSVQATRFIQVQYADVTEIAQVITEMLNVQQTAQQTAGVQRAPQAGAPAPQGAAEGSGAGISVPVQVVPEPRTNRIFAMGRPVDLVFVENLVREFDIPTSEKTFLRRKLKFLTVSDFLPIAGDALTRAFTGTADGLASNATSGNGNRQSNARPTTNTRNNRNNNNSNSSSFGGEGGSGGSGVSLGEPDATSAPESMLVGRTLLVADNITNSIVAQGPPPALKIIENLLDQIDVRPDQVMISTVIGQLTLNDSTELGFNYLVDGKDVRGGGGGDGFEVIGPPDVPIGTFPAFNPASIAGSGLRVFGTVGDLNSYIRALSSKTDFTVLSRPSIFTSNNQKGIIQSGEKIAIPTEGGTSTGNFSSGTRIQYEDVVLKLEVIPLVNADKQITMKIALLNDEQNGTQIIQGAGTNGGDLSVPRIITRELLTNATVPNNQTIVLGGLIVGREGKEKAGIPILSDIPWVGRLFSSNRDTTDRTELMVFIQPTVIDDENSLTKVQEDMNSRYDVSGRANQFGTEGSPLFGDPDVEDADEPKSSGFVAPKKLKGPAHRRH